MTASAVHAGPQHADGSPFDEEDWTDPSYKTVRPYVKSKVGRLRSATAARCLPGLGRSACLERASNSCDQARTPGWPHPVRPRTAGAAGAGGARGMGLDQGRGWYHGNEHRAPGGRFYAVSVTPFEVSSYDCHCIHDRAACVPARNVVPAMLQAINRQRRRLC